MDTFSPAAMETAFRSDNVSTRIGTGDPVEVYPVPSWPISLLNREKWHSATSRKYHFCPKHRLARDQKQPLYGYPRKLTWWCASAILVCWALPAFECSPSPETNNYSFRNKEGIITSAPFSPSPHIHTSPPSPTRAPECEVPTHKYLMSDPDQRMIRCELTEMRSNISWTNCKLKR